MLSSSASNPDPQFDDVNLLSGTLFDVGQISNAAASQVAQEVVGNPQEPASSSQRTDLSVEAALKAFREVQGFVA